MMQIFDIPDQRKVRLIIDTDARNEADDQFAIVQALLSPKLVIRSIIGAHFGRRRTDFSMKESYREVVKILELMDLENPPPVHGGGLRGLENEAEPQVSEGAQFIVDEALRDDPMPLFAIFLGPLTDMASALLMNPAIEDRLTVIWVGGEAYPEGGWEFNLSNDVNAANVVMKSGVRLWQVPKNVYCTVRTGIAELEYRLRRHGAIGSYLVQQLIDFNNSFLSDPVWPLGESWSMGDSTAVGLLLDPHDYDYREMAAPHIRPDMSYGPGSAGRRIRVYDRVDPRFILEDLFAKVALAYPEEA